MKEGQAFIPVVREQVIVPLAIRRTGDDIATVVSESGHREHQIYQQILDCGGENTFIDKQWPMLVLYFSAQRI